jgi:hypothetical protein
MTRREPLPDEIASRPFTVAEARKLGVTGSRLRSDDLNNPFYGVRVRGEAEHLVSRALAYAARMPAHEMFSHVTAAALLGLRLPEGFRDESLHVSSLAPHRAPRGRGLTGHQVRGDRRHIVLPNGLRAAIPHDTWCDLSAPIPRTRRRADTETTGSGYRAVQFSPTLWRGHTPRPFTVDDLVVMGDGLLRRISPLTTIDEMRSVVAQRAGRPGHRSLVQALELIRPNTDSARETMLRLLLVRAGLPEPQINVPIVNEFGAAIAHGDLAFVAQRVLVEYDGGHHRTDERQYNIDIDRLDSIMDLGWRVIRVNKASMIQAAQLVAKIRHAVEQRQ